MAPKANIMMKGYHTFDVNEIIASDRSPLCFCCSRYRNAGANGKQALLPLRVQTRLYSFRLDWSIVSLTAANTNRIFSVSANDARGVRVEVEKIKQLLAINSHGKVCVCLFEGWRRKGDGKKTKWKYKANLGLTIESFIRNVWFKNRGAAPGTRSKGGACAHVRKYKY